MKKTIISIIILLNCLTFISCDSKSNKIEDFIEDFNNSFTINTLASYYCNGDWKHISIKRGSIKVEDNKTSSTLRTIDFKGKILATSKMTDCVISDAFEGDYKKEEKVEYSNKKFYREIKDERDVNPIIEAKEYNELNISLNVSRVFEFLSILKDIKDYDYTSFSLEETKNNYIISYNLNVNNTYNVDKTSSYTLKDTGLFTCTFTKDFVLKSLDVVRYQSTTINNIEYNEYVNYTLETINPISINVTNSDTTSNSSNYMFDDSFSGISSWL